MAKSVNAWKDLIEGKGPTAIAELILGDLIGYRKTSLKRSEDVDTLVNVIAALKEEYL
jgi:hypothetical protein